MRNKLFINKLLLIIGSVTSKLGDIIFDYASSIWIVKNTINSSFILGMYQSSQTIINIFFNLIGGVYSDKSNKRNLLVYTDMICGIVCLIMSFFVHSKFFAVLLIVTNLILAILFSFNSPTYKSITKIAINEDEINQYNSWLSISTQITKVIAPIVAMFIVKLGNIFGALMFNAITFFISALCEKNIYVHDVTKLKKKNTFKQNIVDIKEGLKYVYNTKEILYLIIISSFVNFFLAGYNLFLPYTNFTFKSVSENMYSNVLVAESVGGIIGAFINGKVLKNISTKALVSFLFVSGLSLVLFPTISLISKNMIIDIIPIMLFQCSLTIFNIQFMSIIQTIVDYNYIGRVFSVIFTISVLFMPLGTFFFSCFFNTKSVYGYYFLGIGVVCCSILAILLGKNKTLDVSGE